MGISPSEAGPRPVAYALIVGSNRPGAGQEALQYALRDSDRVRRVLIELGGYKKERARLLHNPNSRRLRNAIRSVFKQLDYHRKRGEQTTFLFYYSGHARARTITLGQDEIPLVELRRELEMLPSTVKLIILDACQTGAISNIKGVEPAASFSHNSVSQLNITGMAVMASSTASELAQESERLEGSFFTHHLVVGLRGAADTIRDGRISLSEAYQYAYNRTLVDTARTAVGKQHVTLETNLRGKGEMVITWPSKANSWLELPTDLQGDIVIHRTKDRVVFAEVHKASGDNVLIALPPSAYRAVVRQKKKARRCDIDIDKGKTSHLHLKSCVEVPLEEWTSKGGLPRRREHLFLELGLGAIFKGQDSYNETLSDYAYGYDTAGISSKNMSFHFTIGAYYSILRYLQVGIVFSSLDSANYKWPKYTNSSSTGNEKTFSWHAYRIAALVRGSLPILDDWLQPFLQIGGGAAYGKTDYADNRPGGSGNYTEFFWGYHLSGGGGIQLNPWRHVGFFCQSEYIWAPAIKNLFDEVHNSGGVTIATGVRGGF